MSDALTRHQRGADRRFETRRRAAHEARGGAGGKVRIQTTDSPIKPCNTYFCFIFYVTTLDFASVRDNDRQKHGSVKTDQIFSVLTFLLISIFFPFSISNQDAYLPPHLYGRLASTPEGAEVLARDSSVLEAVQNVRRAEPDRELNQR